MGYVPRLTDRASPVLSLVLHRAGFIRPECHHSDQCALTALFHPYPPVGLGHNPDSEDGIGLCPAPRQGGIVSVTLSVHGRFPVRSLAIHECLALWCPDFPLRCGPQRPSDPPPRKGVQGPKKGFKGSRVQGVEGSSPGALSSILDPWNPSGISLLCETGSGKWPVGPENRYRNFNTKAQRAQSRGAGVRWKRHLMGALNPKQRRGAKPRAV